MSVKLVLVSLYFSSSIRNVASQYLCSHHILSITRCSFKLCCHSLLRQTSDSSAHVTLHWDLHHILAYDPITEMDSCRDLQPALRTITKVFSLSTHLISPLRAERKRNSWNNKHAYNHHISVNPVPVWCCPWAARCAASNHVEGSRPCRSHMCAQLRHCRSIGDTVRTLCFNILQ